MNRKFEIWIRGNDVFEHEINIMAANFADAYEKAKRLMAALQKTTIERLDISSIAEYN